MTGSSGPSRSWMAFRSGQYKRTNVVTTGRGGRRASGMQVFLNPTSPIPKKRYMMVYTQQQVDLAYSADGLHWDIVEKPLLPYKTDFPNHLVYVPETKSWMLYARPAVEGKRARACAGRTTSHRAPVIRSVQQRPAAFRAAANSHVSRRTRPAGLRQCVRVPPIWDVSGAVFRDVSGERSQPNRNARCNQPGRHPLGADVGPETADPAGTERQLRRRHR